MTVELKIADDTVGFVFENVIDQDDVDQVKVTIESRLESNTSVNLYLEEDKVDEIKMDAFVDQVIFDLKHGDKIKKFAVVSDKKWVRGVAKIKDILISSNVQAFELKERVDAICWIMNA